MGKTSNSINIDEVIFDKVSVDHCGKLFRWNSRLFRAIHSESVDLVKDMFSCGMVDDLVERRLFPGSRITRYSIEGYGLVVEHDLIDPVSYPFEWTFSMLKDAALAVLNTNNVARKYGYQTKDCHPYNICYDGTSALFVDLGSFIKTTGGASWEAYEEFVTSYCYPLYLWSHGNSYFARKMLFSFNMTESIPHTSLVLYRTPLARFMHSSHLKIIADLYSRFLRVKPINFTRIIKRIERIRRKDCESNWKDYHDEYYDEKGEPVLSSRFKRVIEILKQHDIKSIVELGGNRGVFSQLAAKHCSLEKIICTDYDEEAVDLMFLELKKKDIKISPALVDTMFPLMNYYESPPFERFKCDASVALALTHHLVLSQDVSPGLIFELISRYSKRYVFVEFMPLGLHDGKKAPPLPLWYTIDWFRNLFAKYFQLILEERLDENRIIFFGELKQLNERSVDK